MPRYYELMILLHKGDSEWAKGTDPDDAADGTAHGLDSESEGVGKARSIIRILLKDPSMEKYRLAKKKKTIKVPDALLDEMIDTLLNTQAVIGDPDWKTLAKDKLQELITEASK